MENMTIAQLKEVAAQKGISYSSKIKKADLISKLSAIITVPQNSPNRFRGEY